MPLAPHNFRLEREGDALVVSVLRNVSSLVEETMKAELAQLQSALEDPTIKGVVFDFDSIEYFGSTMLEAMLRVWGGVQKSGRRMSICNVSRVGREVLHVSKFDTIWGIHNSRQAAISDVAA
jgi:anti-anti-sigma factor